MCLVYLTFNYAQILEGEVIYKRELDHLVNNKPNKNDIVK